MHWKPLYVPEIEPRIQLTKEGEPDRKGLSMISVTKEEEKGKEEGEAEGISRVNIISRRTKHTFIRLRYRIIK